MLGQLHVRTLINIILRLILLCIFTACSSTQTTQHILAVTQVPPLETAEVKPVNTDAHELVTQVPVLTVPPTIIPTLTLPPPVTIERITVTKNGSQGDMASFFPSISADGRYIAFSSAASNFVKEDTNENFDVFVLEQQTGVISLVSVSSNGTQGNGQSSLTAPSISGDGRYIAFASDASNLVSGDTNGVTDIFVYDRITGETSRVSVSSEGIQGNNHSGRYLFFSRIGISADGRFVTFDSLASNLVAGDTNEFIDIFVHDRLTGETNRVSIADDGTQGNGESAFPSISADGRFISYMSYATNLVANDTNNACDTFVFDLEAQETNLISLSSEGEQGNKGSWASSISEDGRYVVFSSDASNLVVGDNNESSDIFIHDMVSGETTLISISSDGTQGNGSTYIPSISADGRYVLFASKSSNLVIGDTNDAVDVFLHDRVTGDMSMVSISSDGRQGNADSGISQVSFLAISADGQYMVFDSGASTLVIGDTNNAEDVFIHRRDTGETIRVSVANESTLEVGYSESPSVSADGRYVVFQSYDSGLVDGDVNNWVISSYMTAGLGKHLWSQSQVMGHRGMILRFFHQYLPMGDT